MNDQLDRIEKMLRAQLRSAGHLWWIGGYVYGQTSNDDLFIILYPADEKLNEKVVRVYPHDFKKLPPFIPTLGVDGGDTEGNPNKEQARKKRIYHECPPFEIVTHDGKDTQMGKERRFSEVTRLSRKASEAAAASRSQGQPSNAPPQPSKPVPPAVAPPSPPPPEPEWDPPATSRLSTAVPQAQIAATQPTLVQHGLPDYRGIALGAKTATEFDYAAYMALRDELYTDQERIAQARQSLIPAWKPGERANSAMLMALETYRDQRAEAEKTGGVDREARLAAQREARNQYNEAVK